MDTANGGLPDISSNPRRNNAAAGFGFHTLSNMSEELRNIGADIVSQEESKE